MFRSNTRRARRIRAAVDALPEPQALVFRLHAGEGQEYARIADRLGVSPAEVERLLADALVAIDRHLGS